VRVPPRGRRDRRGVDEKDKLKHSTILHMSISGSKVLTKPSSVLVNNCAFSKSSQACAPERAPLISAHWSCLLFDFMHGNIGTDTTETLL
jgi:hypothetical protein